MLVHMGIEHDGKGSNIKAQGQGKVSLGRGNGLDFMSVIYQSNWE